MPSTPTTTRTASMTSARQDRGRVVLLEIDYYDRKLEFGSDDPADPANRAGSDDHRAEEY
jgi:hypothetical protein